MTRKSLLNAMLLSVLSCATLPLVASAQTPDAMTDDERDEAFQQALDKANKLYEDKKLEEALEHFKRAYEIKPEPKLLFNMGIISERLGKLEDAVGFYDKFVVSPDVTLELRAQGQKRLDILRPIVKSQREERERAEQAERERLAKQNNTGNANTNSGEQGGQGPKKKKDDEPTNTTRVASYIIAGTGVALAGVGGVMLLTMDPQDAFMQEAAPQDRRNARESRNNQKITGTILAGSGGALLATGLILWAISGDEEAKPAQTGWQIVPQLNTQGASVGIFTRF